jgi:hypothetical protein
MSNTIKYILALLIILALIIIIIVKEDVHENAIENYHSRIDSSNVIIANQQQIVDSLNKANGLLKDSTSTYRAYNTKLIQYTNILKSQHEKVINDIDASDIILSVRIIDSTISNYNNIN